MSAGKWRLDLHDSTGDELMTAARLCLSRALHLPPQVCASASLLTQLPVHAACLFLFRTGGLPTIVALQRSTSAPKHRAASSRSSRCVTTRHAAPRFRSP